MAKHFITTIFVDKPYNLNAMYKKLTRSPDSMLGGVCPGIAEYFNIDPTLVRVGWALLCFLTAFTAVPIYLLLWLIVPMR